MSGVTNTTEYREMMERKAMIDQEITQLLRKRQQLIEGSCEEGVYKHVPDEQREKLYEAYNAMIEALEAAAHESSLSISSYLFTLSHIVQLNNTKQKEA